MEKPSESSSALPTRAGCGCSSILRAASEPTVGRRARGRARPPPEHGAGAPARCSRRPSSSCPASEHTGGRGRPSQALHRRARGGRAGARPARRRACLVARAASGRSRRSRGGRPELGPSARRAPRAGREPDEDAVWSGSPSLLRRRGFAPERPDGLVMHRCPFRELAERYPRVVCSLHAGLIDGALEELGRRSSASRAWSRGCRRRRACSARLADRAPKPRRAEQEVGPRAATGLSRRPRASRLRVGRVARAARRRSRTTSTGHGAWRMTALETLPSRSEATVPCPRVPIAIRRAPISAA